MSLTFKKALLAGTALVAASAFSTQAQANARSMGANSTWALNSATTICPNSTGLVTDGCSGEAVDITATSTLTVTNDGVADDGGGLNTFTLGAVTNSAGTGALTITNINNSGGALAVTLASVNVKGNMAIDNLDTTNANAVNATVTGALTVGGTLTITAANKAGSTANLTVGGNTNVTGGIILNDSAAATTKLTFNGGSAQSVTGTIVGASAGEGALVVSNSAGVTFNSAVGGTQLGTLLVSKTGGDSSATFKGAVNIAAMTMGDGAGTGTNTITFDGTGGAYSVTGTIDGDGAGNDTNNIVVQGGKTITTVNQWGNTNALDNVTVTGSGTMLSLGATIKATQFTLASGGTIRTGGNKLDGALDGAGTLDVTTGDGHVTGNIGSGTAVTAINIGGTRQLTAGADVKATTITMTGAGAILALTAANHTVTSTIVATTDGTGTITIADGANTTNIVGNVGTSTSKLAALTVSGGSANEVTTTGNLYVNAITQNDADTLKFIGTSAQTVSGTINGGTLTVGTGGATDVTFSSALGGSDDLAAVNVAASAKATFSGNVTTNGTVTNAGTITVASGKTLASNTVANGSVGTYNIGVNASGGTTSIGKITESGDAANYSNDTINFVVGSGSSALTVGTIANVFTGNAGATAPGVVTDNSYLYKFTPTVNGNNIDVAVAFENTINSVATNANNAAVGNTLLTSLAGSSSSGINTLQNVVLSASSAAGVNNALETMQNTADGSSVMPIVEAGGMVQDIAETRVASLRAGDALGGTAAGVTANGNSMWLQGYGEHASQDTRSAIKGYDADTWGGTIGVDTANVINNGIVGVSINYGTTKADSKNLNTTKTDVDSYGINLYTGMNFAENMFMNAQAGYAYNQIDTTRHDTTGVGSGTTAKGDTNADQYTAKLSVGRDYASDYGMTLTPKVSAAYTHLSTDGYSETGTGALTVADADFDNLKIGLGGEVSWNTKASDGSTFKPVIRAGYAYSVINDRVETSSSYVADATHTAFNVNGAKPSPSTFNAGLGFAYMTLANWDLSANYDYTYRSNYDAHAGTIRATSHF